MFISFFYLLRSRELDVSLNEWLTLTEALDKGLAGNSLTGFYYLARSILVKSETDFDKFDGAFLEYFKDIKTYEELPKELLDWLNNPKEKKNNYDKAQDEKNLQLSLEEIQKMLMERLAEQESHQRSCDQQLKGQGHDEVSGNVYQPYHGNRAPSTGVGGGLHRTVEGHDQHHGHHHAAGNRNHGFQGTADSGFDQKPEGKSLGQFGHQKPIAAHGKNVSDGESQPSALDHGKTQLPVKHRHIVHAHPQDHHKTHQHSIDQTFSLILGHLSSS